jgi:MscS family membrane protein
MAMSLRFAVVIAALAIVVPAHAAETAKPAPSASASTPPNDEAAHAKEADSDEPESPDSPRASMAEYLARVRRGAYADAAEYLDVPKDRQTDAPVLARRLIAVLDRYDWVDLDKISSRPGGNADDGLPQNYEEIGTVPGDHGIPSPVRLVRRPGKPVRWVFTRTTVQNVDHWYDGLADRWFLDHLPAPLLRSGPRGLMWWQWVALPLLIVAAGAAGAAASWGVRRGLGPIIKRTPTQWDDAMLERLGGPIALALSLLGIYLALPALALYEPAEMFLGHALRGGVLFDFFWALSRVMDVGARMLVGHGATRQRRGSMALISLLARVGKVVVAALAVVAFVSELGYPVASVIAGLGIGGLSIALAAQKTMENLFGAFSIGADQPFREGDFIKVDDVVGTVETIGLRSTRIRTLDRTLVTMPNGKLADSRVESFSARDRIRFSGTIALPRNTSPRAIEQILAAFEKKLGDHPKVWPDGIYARLSEVREASLNVETSCWFQTSEWEEFQQIRQEVLLAFVRIIEDAGKKAAAPARSSRSA